MEQKSLSRWLRAIILGIAICGFVVFVVIIPRYGASLAKQYPEFADRYWPWLIFLWLTAIPCFIILLLGNKIAINIGSNRSFTEVNAGHLKLISLLAAGDSAFFFIGNALMLLFNMSHPGITLLSMLAVFAGIAVSVAAACLSHLVRKAAALQAENDLTI